MYVCMYVCMLVKYADTNRIVKTTLEKKKKKEKKMPTDENEKKILDMMHDITLA